jgi:hypothetical protein
MRVFIWYYLVSFFHSFPKTIFMVSSVSLLVALKNSKNKQAPICREMGTLVDFFLLFDFIIGIETWFAPPKVGKLPAVVSPWRDEQRDSPPRPHKYAQHFWRVGSQHRKRRIKASFLSFKF